MIKGSINVSLVNRDRLFQGKKGKYLNIVLIETPNSEYGDFMISEDVSKEERAKGVKGTILGNAKVFNKGSGKPTNAPGRAVAAKEEEDPGVPF